MDEKKIKEYLNYTKALLDSMRESAGRSGDNPWRFISFRTYMRKYDELVTNVARETKIDGMLDHYDLDKVPSEYDTAGVQQRTLFESVYSNLSILKSFLENKLDLKQDEIRNLKDFLQGNLRKAIFQPPEKEIEVQNAIEQLFIGRGLSKGIDYDRETGRVKISIKESVPDFILPRLNLSLEVKLVKDKSKAKEVVDEINSDIRTYSIQYSNQMYVVYDLGVIRDEAEFKSGIERKDDIVIIVVKQ